MDPSSRFAGELPKREAHVDTGPIAARFGREVNMRDQRSSLRYSGSVCISGLTAAGKTTHSHLLAGEFGLIYVSASQIQLNFLGLSPRDCPEFR